MQKHRFSCICILFAVAVIFGCSGIGFSMPSMLEPEYPKVLVVNANDTLVQEIVDFLDPKTKLNNNEQKQIERRIKGFPHTIIRRDTATYFLQTAYAVAFYEFVKLDYKKGLSIVKEFDKNAMPPDFLKSIWFYSSVGLNASTSLQKKGNIKAPQKKEKNSWWTPLNFTFSDSIFSGKRTAVQFLETFFDDLPMTCQTGTFLKILKLYHSLGGKLEWLNPPLYRKGFFQKCKESKREDVFEIIYSLWNVDAQDFEFDTLYQQLEFKQPSFKLSFSTSELLRDLSVEGKIEKTDSLIAIGNDATDIIIALLNQTLGQNKFKATINFCEQYGQFVSDKRAMSLHNIWGLACLSIGKYEDALYHLDKAILFADNPNNRSAVSLNKASVLGELYRTSEAVEIFNRERKNQKTPFKKFVWNDNLGYVYSLRDPKIALYYYEQAEKYLDGSLLYDERKVRYFCRKAHTQEWNQYLYRSTLDRAFDIVSHQYASKITKGMIYVEEGRYFSSVFDFDKADMSYNKAYEGFKWLDAEDSRMYELNRNYSYNLCALGRSEEAISILSEQLALQDSILGSPNIESLKTLQILITAYCKSSKDTGDNVKELYDRYERQSREANFYIDPFDDIIVRSDYFSAQGMYEDAIKLLKESNKANLSPQQRISLMTVLEKFLRKCYNAKCYQAECKKFILPLKHDVVEVLLSMNENERHSIQSPLQEIIEGMISAGNIEDALTLSLFKKGLLFATKQSIQKRLRSNTRKAKDLNKLNILRVRLNDAIAFGDNIHIPIIQSELFKFERRLNHKLSSEKKLFSFIDRTIEQVRSNLKDNDIALDFIKYKNDDTFYLGVFVINSGLQPTFISLGEEEKILENPYSVWSKLEPDLINRGDIYFCLDGKISTIGIEFLEGVDGIPVNQKFRLHRVFHLSDISKAGTLRKEIVLIGVSDHNSPVGEGETINRGNFTDLPNVGYELKLINNCLSELSPKLLFNDDANELKIKSLDGNMPSVLHFSTHGFYRSNSWLQFAAKTETHPDFNIARRTLSANKKSLSGLVLRSGNLSWKTPEILEKEDDILTSEEVETLSFPNLQLTVLSACESGLGDIDEDGIWGLQRAFRIAGSKSLLCTVHNIPDYETAFFMEQFYKGCAEGNNIFDSFQTAQRILYEEYIDNPNIWTAFILIE